MTKAKTWTIQVSDDDLSGVVRTYHIVTYDVHTPDQAVLNQAKMILRDNLDGVQENA